MKELVKIDQITAAELSSAYRVESMKKTENEIRYLKDKMTLVSRASVIIAFEMGRRLAAVKDTLDHGQFEPWLEQNFQLSDRTARRYMQLYDRFRDEPAAILEDLSIQEAYVMAGVKKAASPKLLEDGEDEDELRFAGKRDPEAEKANMVALFKMPTLSGVKLKNHRVQNIGGRIYVYRKDVGTVSPGMDLFMPKPDGLPEPDWIEFQRNFEIAMELYLAKVEQYEATGLVAPPEDYQMLSVVERLEEKKASAARKGRGASGKVIPFDGGEAVG